MFILDLEGVAAKLTVALNNTMKSVLRKLRVHDLSVSQAWIICKMDCQEKTVGELFSDDVYYGTNSPYIIKKLTQNGYITLSQSPHDGRCTIVSLTEKGNKVSIEIRNTMQGEDISDIRAKILKVLRK